MLKIKNLKVKTAGKEVIKGINLEIPKGKVYTIFGPNGSGKTTLLMAILGFPRYKAQGKIIFKGKDISRLSPDRRAKLGIGISFQRPPTIDGLSFKNFIDSYSKISKKELEKLANTLKVSQFLEREINKGMSGGEIKRGEIFQVLSQAPDFLLLDEPESGVDVENINVIGKSLANFLKDKKKSALIITHSGEILKYFKSDKGLVMVNGRITCFGNPRDVLATIKKVGYKNCKTCHRKTPKHH
ncbi:MAG: ABC transporter ATP-binding protein [Candidatus Pacebacteria bacterium]|nr:ABC transporter ATP-binding protein [Candidatus Paceibacterota bacterium]